MARKHIHWQMGFSSDSPYHEMTSDTSMISSSSLEYVNAQLVAHGFVPSPGLCLDGTSNDNSTRVVKCLLGLLDQRVQDMSRMEDLTVKCRTLTYDLERMRSLHGNEVEKSANAEREMNLHKSRMATSLKNLQATENMQKQTAAELQRTKTLLQGVRAAHQAEIKKKEKEVERVLDKWQKIADLQSKPSASHSGMRCSNAAVVDGTQVMGKGSGFLDVALEQSEQARNHLNDENLMLRKIILRTTNEFQSLLHKARTLLPGNANLEQPPQFTMTSLLVPSAPLAISGKVAGVFNSLEQIILSLGKAVNNASTSQPPNLQVSQAELQRLQDIITQLKEDLAASRKQALVQITETQNFFDKFASDQRRSTREVGDMSVELMSIPQRDEEQERLEKLRAELDLERQRFTEATIRLGKEKAELAAERFRLIEDKRSWEVEKMLADLSGTPNPLTCSKSRAHLRSPSPKKLPHKATHKSPHKSPRKFGIVTGKASGSRNHRVSRTSLASPGKVTSYETELIPPPIFPPIKSFPPSSSLLPTSFVLPPPSPRASLPTGPAWENTPTEILINEVPLDSVNLLATPAPIQLPFPMAKPFAQKMIHAYSPARPSPLSRILMLGDSPLTPPKGVPGTNDALSPVLDSTEGDSQDSLERAILGVGTITPPILLREDTGEDEKHDEPPFAFNANGKKAKERPKSSAVNEKENSRSRKQKVVPKPSSGTAHSTRKVSPATNNITNAVLKTVPKAVKTVPKEKAVVKPSGGGPRRVAINSAEAPAIAKVWKG